jgi:pimeloyl-ACP methyl ester carboxylesterase
MDIHQLELRTARPTPELEFHYVEEGQGVPLVFIHGLTGDYGSWGAQWPAFAPRFRAISYSRRFSRPNRNDPRQSPQHSVRVEAQDLALLLACWGAEPAVLVGSSFGAFTALALAAEQPQRVRALVLCEPPVMAWADLVPGGRALRESFERDTVRPARELFRRGEDLQAATLYAQGVLGPSGVDGLPESARERRFANVEAVKALSLAAQDAVAPDGERLARLAIPTLLLSGQRTRPLFAAVFEAACRLMPHVEAHRVADAGHSVYREQPEAFNRLALEFLQRRLRAG